MQGQDSGYFVRLGSGRGDTATTARPDASGHETPMPKGRRRHRRLRVSPVTVLGLVVLGWFAWAATTPGGIHARLDGIGDKVRGAVDDATTDPGLHRAAVYYNDRFEREGQYPDLTEEQLRDDPAAGFGVGVDIEWCAPNAIVLQSMSGRGTISRLLLNGRDLGDELGELPCPANLANPHPWSTAAD